MDGADGKQVLLEVAIGSVEDAHAAHAGGAGRVELNAGLALGGLTPSLGLLLEVRTAVPLPVIAMLRPRPGGFAYSAPDFTVMQRDLDLLRDHGADGIALGVLTDRGEIDLPRCRRLVVQAAGCPVIFHRAFDLTPDPLQALDQLIDLGVKRVLTSGQAPTALQGAPLLARLIERGAGKIEVLPAAGINAANAAELVARTGCNQVHASLRTRRPDSSTQHRPQLTFGKLLSATEEGYDATDPAAVAALVALLQQATG